MIDQGSSAGTDQEPSEDEDSEGLDVERVKEMVGFVLRSARRRSKLAILTFAVVSSLGIAVAMAMPQVYNVQMKLLAERSHIDDTNPNRRSGTVERPTQDLAAMILRRDNLVALVRDAHLVDRFDQGRSSILRLKDRMMAALSGPPTAEDRELGLVFSLEKRLTVEVLPDDATAVISVDWPNAQSAYDLVTLVQKNFLEARYDTEVSTISDIISVSEEHAKDEVALVDAALADYTRIVAERLPLTAEAPNKPVAAPGGGVAIGARIGPSGAVMPAAGRPDPALTKALEAKRQRIKALEESQQRTLEALRQQLAQAQLTLTPLHPTVIGLQQQIEAVNEPSPELAQLRDDERALMAQIAPIDSPAPRTVMAPPRGRLADRIAEATGSSSSSTSSSSSSAATEPSVTLPTLDRDGQVQLAESRLASAIRTYQEAMSRVDSAKLELQTERVAFKHRYTVVTPAELPRKPKKATATLIGVGAVLGGALLALLLAAGADMMGGRVLETWQVRRRLKLDVLGELDTPS